MTVSWPSSSWFFFPSMNKPFAVIISIPSWYIICSSKQPFSIIASLVMVWHIIFFFFQTKPKTKTINVHRHVIYRGFLQKYPCGKRRKPPWVLQTVYIKLIYLSDLTYMDIISWYTLLLYIVECEVLCKQWTEVKKKWQDILKIIYLLWGCVLTRNVCFCVCESTSVNGC